MLTVLQVVNKYPYPTRQNLLDAAFDYSKAHYHRDGFDFVVETMVQDTLDEVIGRARTVRGALRKTYRWVKPLDEHRKEVQSA